MYGLACGYKITDVLSGSFKAAERGYMFNYIMCMVIMCLLVGLPLGLATVIDTKIEKKKEQKERIKEEEERREREKREAEERRLKAERERKKKEAEERNRKEGDELYRQATAEDNVDEGLIRRAADLGCRPACLYIGRQMMEEWATGAYTKREKADIAEKAKEYFYIASSEEDSMEAKTEARFGYLFFKVVTESGNDSKWKEVLSQLRDIQKSGMLPENYNETCVLLIQNVVNLVDTSTSSRVTIKRTYCKFYSAGSCTKNSTSYRLCSCNYISNPGDCATALIEGGLGFEFED